MEPILSNDFQPSPFFDWYDWEWHDHEWIHIDDDLDYPLAASSLEEDSSEIGFYFSVGTEESYKNTALW